MAGDAPNPLMLVDVFYRPFTTRPMPTSALDVDVVERRNLLGCARRARRVTCARWADGAPRIVVHQLWESAAQDLGMKGLTTMKRHRHTPGQVVRKLRGASDC